MAEHNQRSSATSVEALARGAADTRTDAGNTQEQASCQQGDVRVAHTPGRSSCTTMDSHGLSSAAHTSVMRLMARSAL